MLRECSGRSAIVRGTSSARVSGVSDARGKACIAAEVWALDNRALISYSQACASEASTRSHNRTLTPSPPTRTHPHSLTSYSHVCSLRSRTRFARTLAQAYTTGDFPGSLCSTTLQSTLSHTRSRYACFPNTP